MKNVHNLVVACGPHMCVLFGAVMSHGFKDIFKILLMNMIHLKKDLVTIYLQ